MGLRRFSRGAGDRSVVRLARCGGSQCAGNVLLKHQSRPWRENKFDTLVASPVVASPVSVRRLCRNINNHRSDQYEAAFLKRRYQPYGDNRKLAHHLGLSVTALDARARELGIPKRRRWTRTEKQRPRERLEEDHSYQQIAVQLRRSVTAVRVQACGWASR